MNKPHNQELCPNVVLLAKAPSTTFCHISTISAKGIQPSLTTKKPCIPGEKTSISLEN
jgi:hypothetical protein